MTNRRKGRFARPPGRSEADEPLAATDAPAQEAVAAPIADAQEAHREPLHEQLLEGVSTEAIQAHPRAEPADGGSAEATETGASSDVSRDPGPDAAAMAGAAPHAEPLPEPVVPTPVAAQASAEAVPALSGPANDAGPVPLLAATPLALSEMNAALLRFARGEGEAALAHVRALARARSPGELVQLQIGEVQRAANASLLCWGELARSAGRLVGSMRRP